MSALATLLTLADSRLPAGAHVHSGGVEEAVTSGLVTNLDTLEAFLRRRIRSTGLITASIAAAVQRNELSPDAADHETDARTPAPAAREASRSQGRGLARLARRVWPDACWDEIGDQPHLAVTAGRVGAVSGLSPEQTALALVYTTMTGSATAAQRLLALDPADVAACTFRLAELCEHTAAEAAVGLADLSDPLLDTLAQRHAERERPLFVPEKRCAAPQRVRNGVGVGGVTLGVGPGEREVQDAQTDDGHRHQQNDVVVVPGLIGLPRPGEVDDGRNAVDQRADVDGHSPAAQPVLPLGHPALDPRPQGGQHHHLECDVDAHRAEADQLGERVAGDERPDDQHRRDDDRDEQGVGRHVSFVVELRQQPGADDHVVAAVGVDEPAGGGLQAQRARHERDQHDAQDDLGADAAERRLQDGVDRIGVLTADHRAEVGDRKDQAQADEGGRRAADVDGAAHSLRDLYAGIPDFLGDVAARLEAEELVERDQAGGQEGVGVAVVTLGAEAVEQHPEIVMALGEEQPDTDHQGADQLGAEAENGEVAQHLGAGEVDDGGQGQHDERAQDRGMRRRLEAEDVCHVRARAVGRVRQQRQQREHVDPAGHPCPFASPQPSRPGIDTPGHRELRHHFAEDQRDQHLSDAGDQQAPDHRWAGGGQREREHRVDADHRRQVGEAQREVRPRAHVALEVRLEPQRLELREVLVVGRGFRRRCASLIRLGSAVGFESTAKSPSQPAGDRLAGFVKNICTDSNRRRERGVPC